MGRWMEAVSHRRVTEEGLGGVGESMKKKKRNSRHSTTLVSTVTFLSTTNISEIIRLCHVLKKLFRDQITDNAFGGREENKRYRLRVDFL